MISTIASKQIGMSGMRPSMPFLPFCQLPVPQPKTYASFESLQNPTKMSVLANIANTPIPQSDILKGCHERPLNGLERFFYEITKLGDNETISGYRLKLDGQLPDAQHFQEALKQLQDVMPALKTQINHRQGRPFFLENNPVVPLSFREIDSHGDTFWNQVLSEALTVPFDPAVDPLVQFILIRNPEAQMDELLAVTHHSLIDGEGMLEVFQGLLNLLGGESEGITRNISTMDQNRCNLHIDQQVFRTPKLGYFVKSFMIDFFAKLMLPAFHSKNLSKATQITEMTFSKTESEALYAQSKKNGVSVYGTVAAAAIKASEPYFPKTLAGQLVTTSTPVSLRHRLDTQVRKGELGCFTSIVRDAMFRVNQECTSGSEDENIDFWNLARRAQAGVKQNLAEQAHEVIPFMLDVFFESKGNPSLFTKVTSPDTLILNNLGRQTIQSPNEANFDVKQFSWVTSFGALAPGVSVNFVSVNGELQIVLFSRRLSEEQLQGVSSDIKQALKQACS